MRVHLASESALQRTQMIASHELSDTALAQRAQTLLRLTLDRLSMVRAFHVFVLALALHLSGFALRHGRELFTENLRTGVTLAEKGYLGDPFMIPTGPTGHLAPAYPVVVSAVYRLTGEMGDARSVLELICAVVASFATALLVPLARFLRLPPGSGALAGLFWSAPLFALVELSAEHETVFSAAAVVALMTIAARRLDTRTLRMRDGAVLGALTGIAVHFTPLVLSMMVLGIGASILAQRGRMRVRLAFPIAFALALAVVVAPYTVRNWRVMGSPFFIRDNFGLEIAVSNADNAKATAEENILRGSAMDTHPFKSIEAARQVRSMGEVAYNRMRLREGWSWIRAHPDRFFALTAERTGFLLVPASHRPLQRMLTLLIAAGYFLGVIMLWRAGNRMAAALLVGTVLGYDALYPFVQHDVRYVYPMLRVQSLGAAAIAATVLARLAAWQPAEALEGDRSPAPQGVLA